MRTAFTEKVVILIRSIPKGMVASYGQIAAMAGNRMAARQVVRVINSCWEKDELPWWRLVNSRGTISLTGEGYQLQHSLLEAEGVQFDIQDKIDFNIFLWKGK